MMQSALFEGIENHFIASANEPRNALSGCGPEKCDVDEFIVQELLCNFIAIAPSRVGK
jgi:hypothetical protein